MELECDGKPEYKCPFCDSEIEPNDVNVETDVAICRSCGRTSSVSMVSDLSEAMHFLDELPSKVEFEEDLSGKMTFVYRRVPGILAILVCFIAIGAGVFLLIMIGMDGPIGAWELVQLGLLIPSLVLAIPFGIALVKLLFGKSIVTLHHGAGTVFSGVKPFGRTRHFTYDRDTRISLREIHVKASEIPEEGIVVQNGLDEFAFGSEIDREARLYIAACILNEVAQAS